MTSHPAPHSGSGAARAMFDRQAAEYAVSQPHSSGESLHVLARLAAEAGPFRLAADIATGPGFTAFAMAAHSGHVLATDIAPGMLLQARRLASERGLQDVGLAYAAAEALPFRSASMDLITCRTAPHHFLSPDAFLQETARVLRPGGTFLLADSCTSEDPTVSAWHQDMEKRRDPTHVRNLAPSEWRTVITAAGMQLDFETLTRVEMTFSGWTRRTATPAAVAAEMRAEWRMAPDDVRSEFRMVEMQDGDFSFSWPCYVCRATRSA